MPRHTRRPRRPADRRTSAVLRELQRRAEAMTSGDFQSLGLPVGGSAALEDLRRALDVMGEHVEQAQHTTREYIAALTAAQEAERGHLARELHDETVQHLIVLAQGVDRIQRVYERTPERVPEHLATLRGDITTLIQTLRTTIANLRPPALAELGLVPAVQLFVQPWTTTVPITVTVAGPPRRLDPDSELAVFRIIQECWSNIRRHAQATRVEIAIHYERMGLRVTICDNGQGFTPPAGGGSGPGRWGLRGMRERATLVGGSLEITSAPGQGTQVSLQIPYPGVNSRDPVCGMDVRPSDVGAAYGDALYRFCSQACKELFLSNPARYLPNCGKSEPESGRIGVT